MNCKTSGSDFIYFVWLFCFFFVWLGISFWFILYTEYRSEWHLFSNRQPVQLLRHSPRSLALILRLCRHKFYITLPLDGTLLITDQKLLLIDQRVSVLKTSKKKSPNTTSGPGFQNETTFSVCVNPAVSVFRHCVNILSIFIVIHSFMIYFFISCNYFMNLLIICIYQGSRS